MKKLILLFLASLCFAPLSWTQTTVVPGTVKDVNGVPYAGATMKAQLVLAGSAVNGQPTVTVTGVQACRSSGFGSSPCQVPFQGTNGPITLDQTGSFTLALQDNALVTPVSTQWLFSITTNGAPPPLGTGPQACSATVTITGAAQSVSGSFSACPALSTGSGATTPTSIPGEPGVTAVPVTTGKLAEYRIFPTETAAGILDYSGNGLNATGTVGTAPTIIPVTGGVSCGGVGAINLPASLNPSLTIQMYVSFQWASNLNATNVLVGGNGANSVQLGVSSATDSFSLSPTIVGGQRVRSSAPTSATSKSSSRDVLQGNHVLTFLMDTNDRFFIDSQEVLYYLQNSASAGLQTNGNHQLCGVSPNFATGAIYYVVFYNRVLTSAEVAANVQYMTNAMSARNVKPLNGATDAQSQLICVGDSLTQGGTTYCNAFNIPVPTPAVTPYLNPIYFNTADQGINSFSTPGLVTNIPTDTLSLVRPLAPVNVATFWAGTNDASALQAMGNIRGFCQQVRTGGAKCLPFTMISRGGEDGQKNILNDYLRRHWQEFADGLVDVAAHPNLGADGASANITFFLGDQIHLQNAGNALVTSIAQQAILRATANAAPSGQGQPNTAPPQFQAVQSATFANTSSISSCPVTLPNNTAAGNFLFVSVKGAGGQTINTPTDTRASTWTAVTAATNFGGSLMQAFFAPNITAGAETITVTFGANGINCEVTAVEYSGVATVAPLDAASAILTNTANSVTSNPVTTTAPNELLITYSTALVSSQLALTNYTSPAGGQLTTSPVSVVRVQNAAGVGTGQSVATMISDTLSGVAGGYSGNGTVRGPTPNMGTGIAAFKVGTRVATYQMTGADVLIYCNPSVSSSTINLPDAIGFTGQTFTVKNIQQAGANTCTVAGINSETIDGAASVTVANKATLVVQSQLVSAAAGGANWVQLQNN